MDMRWIYVDGTDDGRISVRVRAGIRGDKTFDDRDAAIAFAEGQMGRRGMVVDTTLMTAPARREKRRQDKSSAR